MPYELDPLSGEVPAPAPDPAPAPSAPASRARWIATGVAALCLALAGLFVWRIWHYASLIRTGALTGTEPAFTQQYTASDRLAKVPLPEEDVFQVGTADDPSLGSPDAPVEIVEFADFGCPYSREASFTLRSLATRYGDRVHYVYRDFPLEEIHPGAQIAAEAGACANAQGKFWEFHDKVYLNQGDLSQERFLQYAQELRLDTDAFAACLFGGTYASEVQQDYQDGIEAGVRGTPTFFINGLRIPGSIPDDALDALVQRILLEQS